MGGKMGQREKLTFVYDADGSIGVVAEFSESDFEAYSMPDLALVGAFQTKAQAAQALGDLLLNSSQRPAALGGASAISALASLGGYVAHRSDAKTICRRSKPPAHCRASRAWLRAERS